MKTVSLMFLFSVTFSVAAQDTTRDTVKKLGDAKFATREKATKELFKKMDFDVFVELAGIYKEEGNQEIRRRVGRLIEAYYDKVRAEYVVDLKGYKAFPWIDEGMPENYRFDGPWEGLNRSKFISVYLRCANESGAAQDQHPHWTNYRKATELWMKERIDHSLQQAIKISKNEKDLRSDMEKSMDRIQKDIEMLIQGDRDYYKKRSMKNPFERENNFIKMP